MLACRLNAYIFSQELGSPRAIPEGLDPPLSVQPVRKNKGATLRRF
jgi:hypothetical protein